MDDSHTGADRTPRNISLPSMREEKALLNASLLHCGDISNEALAFIHEIMSALYLRTTTLSCDELACGDVRQIQDLNESVVVVVFQGDKSDSGALQQPHGVQWAKLLMQHHEQAVVVVRYSTAVEIESFIDRVTRLVILSSDNVADSFGPTFNAIEEAIFEVHRNPSAYTPSPPPPGTHQIRSISKDVLIFPNGHAVTELDYRIVVAGERCESIQHHFGFNEFAGCGPLPSLQKLSPSSMLDRLTKRTFSYRLLEAPPSVPMVSMKPVEEEALSDDMTKVFRFVFDPPIPRGQEIAYSWGVSSPGWYEVHGVDASDFACRHDFLDLNLSVRFAYENGFSNWKFLHEPELWINDPLGVRKGIFPTTAEEHLLAKQYRWSRIAATHGSRYRIIWETV